MTALAELPRFEVHTEQLHPLKMRLYTNFTDLAELQSVWDSAVLKLRGSVYMTFDWLRTWWEFYGEQNELRLFVFTSEKRIVGLLPFYIDRFGFGITAIKIARLVGSNIPPKVFDVPVDESFAEEIFRRVLTHLLQNEKCDLISFGPTSGLRNEAEVLQRVSQSMPKLVGVCSGKKEVHTVFWLPRNMDEYYSSLSKNERKNRRKYDLRLLEKEYSVRIETICDPPRLEQEFENFARQHALQWAQEGKPGHFGSWPRALDYNRALVRAQGASGRVRFIRIVANDEVIANQYVFAFGNSYFWELPSRAIEAKWEKFSLGPTGIVTMLRMAMGESKTRLEGGLAHYDYKLRLGAKEYSAPTLRLVSARPLSALRFKMYSALQCLLKVVYHKIWYRRIAPRLPNQFWRPQPMFWLRLDF